MKKLGKLTLKELGNNYPLLDSCEANKLKGGEDYTEQQMYDKMYAGTWQGGFVTGLGYVTYESSAYAYPAPTVYTIGPSGMEIWQKACAEAWIGAGKTALGFFALIGDIYGTLNGVPTAGQFVITPSDYSGDPTGSWQ
ncbi:MAG: hypothetical protein NTZ69_01155 [Bacteroidia bacterium]|nr:hypothetical protein [Bacteroidia bacterium]